MPAKLIFHVPDGPGRLRVLDDGADVVLGRSADCELVIQHHSVSRRHARLRRDDEGWQLEDLGSKNGMRVDGKRVTSARFSGAQWFALGDVFCEFELIDTAAATALMGREERLRRSSASWAMRMGAAGGSDALLRELLSGIVELAECRRGFLVVGARRADLRVVACFALDAEELSRRTFAGSRSAVERTILERRPVFLSDRRDQAFLRGQPSVVGQGIRTLACLPLIEDGRLLGAVYVDTDDETKVFTELDAELLQAFAQRASTALAAFQLDAMLARMESWLALGRSVTDPGGAGGPARAWTDVLAAADVQASPT